MPSAIISILVAFLLVLGGAAMGELLAQTPTPPPIEHKPAGDHSDRGYQHSFGHAEMWAKEFDDPARDAWQKPDEVLDVLHLERTARVSDLGAGNG